MAAAVLAQTTVPEVQWYLVNDPDPPAAAHEAGQDGTFPIFPEV
jgi:hypothetical protein